MQDILGIYIERWRAAPDAPALSCSGNSLSYAELLPHIGYAASRIRAAGGLPGERVLILLPNGIDQVVACLATFSLGCIAVPLDIQCGSERLKFIIEQTNPGVCMTLPDRVLPGDMQALYPDKPPPGFVAGETDWGGAKPDDTAMLLYSSGSTGRPKGVMVSHRQQCTIARDLADGIGMEQAWTELLLAPSSHSDGWQRIMAAMYVGAHIVFPQGLLSVSNILETIEEERVDSVFIHPTLLRYLIKSRKEKVIKALKHCRSIESGSASLHSDELSQMMALAPHADFFVHYGLSESPRSNLLKAKDEPKRLQTTGPPLPGVEMMIVDQNGNRLPPGRVGEIRVRGSHLAKGYWNQQALFASRFSKGWLRTGDYGSMDEQSFLSFSGRRDDLIASSGFSFYPAEVETELGPLPNVTEYLVAGMPDPKGMIGEEVWIFIVPERRDEWSVEAFYSHARSRLEAYMLPRKIVLVPSIPKTESGKPHRKLLVEMYNTQREGSDDT